MRTRLLSAAALAAWSLAALASLPDLCAQGKGSATGDWPMLGGSPGRNLVSTTAKDLPTEWSVEEGKTKNVRWSQAIGNRGYGSPVIAGGRVFVSTNNKQPRDPNVKGAKAVVMCFDEKTGKFLWQAAHEMAPPPVDQQAREDGMCSTPAVESDRLYFVTPGAVVVCADVKDGKTVWSYDLMKEQKVFPCIINSCSPVVAGDLVFVVTGNGINDAGDVVAPKAPSFAAFDKKTGKLKWQSNLPGADILHGQWGSPAYAEAGGRKQVIFPGGDNYLYSFEAESGKLLWKFHCYPGTAPAKENERQKRNYLITTPAVHGDRVHVALGHAPETGFGSRVGHLWCIDITKTGDVSPAPGNLDPKALANRNSALVWHYGGEISPRPKLGRSVYFGPTLSTPAIHDGLLYMAEEPGYLHCLDAKTGKRLWEHDFKCAVWGSPLWTDGKVYIGTEDGMVEIFAHGRQKKLLGTMDMLEPMHGTPAVANNVLYFTTKTRVFAIGGK